MRFLWVTVLFCASWLGVAEETLKDIPGLPPRAKIAQPPTSPALKPVTSINLVERLSAHTIEIPGEIAPASLHDHPVGYHEQGSVKRILVEPGLEGTAWLVSEEKNNTARVTRLDSSLENRRGEDCVLKDRLIRDIKAISDTLLILALGPNSSFELIRLGEQDGKCVLSSHTQLSTRAGVNHPGALALSEKQISIVAGETENSLHDISREWRLAEGRFEAVALTPHKSIPFSFVGLSTSSASPLFVENGGPYATSGISLIDRGHDMLIARGFDNQQGYTSIRLADAIWANNNIAVAYSEQHAGHRDAKLAIFTAQKKELFNGKISNGPKIALNLHLGSLLGRILVGWRDSISGKVSFGQYNEKGDELAKPQELAAMLQPGGRIRKLSNGDLVWATVDPSNRKRLIIYRIRA